ncbi:MAG: hypothetical protein JNL21_37265 [Myxococcales bacterium]|nr:hypothetical protein [Myxococcales bacterium]
MKQKDDDVLSRLAEVAREDMREPVVGDEAGEQAELARALQAPISERRTEEMAEAALAAFASGPAADREGEADARSRSAEVVPGPGFFRQRRVAAVVTALALAAGIALFVLPREPGTGPERSALPSYELAVSGGQAQLRSEPASLLRIGPGSALVATLRPSTAEREPVIARAYLVRGGEAHPLDLSVTVSPEGAVRLAGTIEKLPIPAGDAELVIAVAREGVEIDPLATSATGAFRRLSQPVLLVEGP